MQLGVLLVTVEGFFMREIRNAFKILVRKPEWKRQQGRPRCIREGNVRMNLKKN
jgi:hypothetical protein